MSLEQAADGRDHKTVSMRLIWPLEAQDFTPWLAANLDRLSEAVGRPLRALPNKAVGQGRIADLLARDETNNSLVIIENQLEPADDAHLGQILAYLAQSDASTLIWVASRFAARHAHVVRWLNRATDPQYRFFAVQARVERRADHGFDPIFEVVVAPDDWVAPNMSRPRVRFEFAPAFWTAHLLRFPAETSLSRQVGPRSRWRAVAPQGVVVGLCVEPRGAAVFIRGRNGVPLSAVHAILSPYATAIKTALGLEIGHPSGAVLVA